MAKRITVMALLLVLCACTLVLNDTRIGLEGVNLALISTTGTNTPTPIFQRYLTVRASTNLRATPSTTSTIVQVIRVDTQALILTEQGSWYRIRIPNGATSFFEGWVRNDRIINPITVTATPRPAPTQVETTPTQETLRINVPLDGLQGYNCMADDCVSSTLRLSTFDNYRVLFMNANWAWICVLDYVKLDCVRQFYVKVQEE